MGGRIRWRYHVCNISCDECVGILTCRSKPETPAMIAFAKSFTEVGALMGCANQTGYQAVPRAGRHQ
jgi:hypothetical protein